MKQQRFDDLTDAKQKRMIEKGWIPAFIPGDARNIQIEGDLDIASLYGRFISLDTSTIRSHCTRSRGSISRPHTPPDWFPREIVEATLVSELEQRGYQMFTCSAENMMFAISGANNTVYYWTDRLTR